MQARHSSEGQFGLGFSSSGGGKVAKTTRSPLFNKSSRNSEYLDGSSPHSTIRPVDATSTKPALRRFTKKLNPPPSRRNASSPTLVICPTPVTARPSPPIDEKDTRTRSSLLFHLWRSARLLSTMDGIDDILAPSWGAFRMNALSWDSQWSLARRVSESLGFLNYNGSCSALSPRLSASFFRVERYGFVLPFR